MIQNTELKGGRIGKIYKVEDKVIRPANPWTPTVHHFLSFLHENGSDFTPIPYGIKDNQEMISFIKGDVYNDPYPKIFTEDKMIISAAKLLSKFHQLSMLYLKQINDDSIWMLPPVNPIEVICHGDFAPYNVVIVHDEASAIIDFDTIHPGSKLWDISYAIYRWIPFIDDGEEKFNDNMRKITLFIEKYGLLEDHSKDLLISVLIDRLLSLTHFMQHEAKLGNIDFQRNIDDGHYQKYMDDIQYLKKNEKKIIKKIIKKI